MGVLDSLESRSGEKDVADAQSGTKARNQEAHEFDVVDPAECLELF